MTRVLIIDDETGFAKLLARNLERAGYPCETAESGEAGIRLFREGNFDVVVADLAMPGLSGLDVLREVKGSRPDTEVIMMTAYASAETAVQAMKQGASDYLVKPLNNEELLLRLAKIEERKRLIQERDRLRDEAGVRVRFENIIGSSPKMQEVFHLIEKVAPSKATVLLRGESGTGKELLAQAIHYHSPRASEPLIKINCAAIPETLLESELFGHEKGAFTNAYQQKKGRFELAGSGTVFLDEIGDLTPTLQVKLLRVLQEGEFERVGGTITLKSEARIIAATNRDLETAMADGEFREDLYYRLNVFPIEVPPLRERRQDIPALVKHLIAKHGTEGDTIEQEALDALVVYSWPGNVRELENVIERSLIMKNSQAITLKDLPGLLTKGTPVRLDTLNIDIPDEGIRFEELEKALILKALEKAEGNKSKAATLLGITRRKLYSRMEVLGLPVKD